MNLQQSAKQIIEVCMGAKKGESVIIITDEGIPSSIPDSIFEAAINAGCEPLIMKMSVTSRHDKEPPKAIAEAMLNSDIVFAPTSKSLTHTQARLNATKRGVRVATMPGITEHMMTSGGITADYDKLSDSANEMFKKLKNGKKIRIVTNKGTDIVFDIEGREWQLDTGICRDKGCFVNLPGGEVFISPKDANGIYVVDGSMGGVGILKSPIEITVKNRYATLIKGEKSEGLSQMLDAVGKNGRNIAELGIGLNPESRLIGNVLEDEKVKGTIHIALGDSSTFGGEIKAGIHIDGIIKNAEMYLDNRKIDLI